MKIKEFAEQNYLKLDLMRIPFRSDVESTEWEKDAKHYAFEITGTQGDCYGKSMRGHFSQGSAIKTKPNIEDILNALVMDITDLDYGFEEWADNLGYSKDSIKALNIYNQCKKEEKDLINLLGDKINDLMGCETL